MVKLNGFNASLLDVLKNFEFLFKHFENLALHVKYFKDFRIFSLRILKNAREFAKDFEKFGIPR